MKHTSKLCVHAHDHGLRLVQFGLDCHLQLLVLVLRLRNENTRSRNEQEAWTPDKQSMGVCVACVCVCAGCSPTKSEVGWWCGVVRCGVPTCDSAVARLFSKILRW